MLRPEVLFYQKYRPFTKFGEYKNRRIKNIIYQGLDYSMAICDRIWEKVEVRDQAVLGSLSSMFRIYISPVHV